MGMGPAPTNYERQCGRENWRYGAGPVCRRPPAGSSERFLASRMTTPSGAPLDSVQRGPAQCKRRPLRLAEGRQGKRAAALHKLGFLGLATQERGHLEIVHSDFVDDLVHADVVRRLISTALPSRSLPRLGQV